jgi:glycosyltransferase involved in cell wall biosynthesis
VSSRRITIVSAQLLGFGRAGGVGSATAFLAISLGRMGHDVDVLYTREHPADPVDADWGRRYEEAGVRIRRLPPLDVRVEPSEFGRMRAVELALRADPPQVVIAHEYGSPAYIPLRLRDLGLAFDDTLFVIYCHGTGRWAKETVGNARMSAEAAAFVRLEEAGVALADLVVSPSAYLLDWMQAQGWCLPPARVIPLVTRATALAEPLPAAAHADDHDRVERLVFFGRLEKIKGVEPFVGALNALEPELLDGVELEFLGETTKYWDPERVEGLLAERTRRALGRVAFETALDQHEAHARLRRPGTLAVIPSLGENSPNVVYECLEGRIPFLASAAGGIGELVAAEDRPRVLFEPTPEGVAAALRRALANGAALRPPRPSFEGDEVLRAWSEVVATQPRASARPNERPEVDVVVHERNSGRLDRCLSAVAAQSYDRIRVIRSPAPSVGGAREQGLRACTADWVVFLDEDDVPHPELVEVLVRAQGASGADVVSCAVRGDDAEHFFPGEPGGAGVLANGYGTIALLRRALLGEALAEWPGVDDVDWPLLARLNAGGARIVSVPQPLARQAAPPGTLEREPAAALAVVRLLEGVLPHQLRLLARIALGLAAPTPHAPPPTARPQPALRRVVGRLRRLRRGL